MAKAPAIEMDSGATFSCVGVNRNGKCEIVAKNQERRITLSYVAFTDGEVLIGHAAVRQMAMNPRIPFLM